MKDGLVYFERANVVEQGTPMQRSGAVDRAGSGPLRSFDAGHILLEFGVEQEKEGLLFKGTVPVWVGGTVLVAGHSTFRRSQYCSARIIAVSHNSERMSCS